MSQTTIDRLNGINEGVSIKAPVDAATTGNITLSGEQTVDGVVLTASVAPTQPMRVLVKNQTDTTKNGIYDVSGSAWKRSLDFNGTRDIVQGTLVFVKAGTANINKLFKVTTASPVIDSSLAFADATFFNSVFINVMDFGAINTGVATPLSAKYATLAAAQVDFPSATALTDETDTVAIEKAIEYCKVNNYNEIYFPVSRTIGGYYRLNKFITIPFTLGLREGMITLIGTIATADEKIYTSVIRRTISAAGFRMKGVAGTGIGTNMIKHCNIKHLVFDGGWSVFNTNSDHPMIDVDAGYEFFWDSAVVTQCLGHGILFREVFDCRFNNLRVTWCGEKHGKSVSLTMTNASTTATCSSTTGIFAGQKIFGTGLNSMYVGSVTNATTLVLSKNANFTGTRTVTFEAKAAVHVCANNTGAATSNNQVITGIRIESGPGCGLRVVGANQVDIWLNQCKIEQTQYAMDYLVDIESAVAFKSRDLWLFGSATLMDRLNFPVTTGGKTLDAALSAGLDTFTLPNSYSVQTGTLTSASTLITGLSDTSLLTVGMAISGTGISSGTSYLGITIASIDSATQVTMSEAATSAAAGTKSLTFKYVWNSGNFNLRQLGSGLTMIAYDTADTRNYMFCRAVNYVETTGVLDLHVLNIFGDTAKSITSWRVMAVHAGLLRIAGAANMCELDIIGGYTSAVDDTTMPYLHTAVHIDGVDGLDSSVRFSQGQMLLPRNSWQAQVSTTSNSIGTGAKTFTIATGLHATMFAANGEVYISGNTVGNAQNWMKGTVTSYTSGTGALVTNITEIQGSGTLTNWKIAFAKQSAYLKTGTNSKMLLKEDNSVYAVPAPSSNFVRPVLSDEVTAFSKTLLDDATAAAFLTTLGGGVTAQGTGAVVLATSPTIASLTTTGKHTTAASVTGGAGLSLPHGAAPSSPVNGDVWTTTAGMFARINGVTFAQVGLFTLSFVSGDTSFTFGSTTTIAHGLGVIPKFIKLRAKCATNDLGYVAATPDIIELASASGDSGASGCGLTAYSDATNIYVAWSGAGIPIIHKTTFAQALMTAASWRLIASAYA